MVNLQPLRPRASRSLYQVRVTLKRVLDLTDDKQLETVDLRRQDLASYDHAVCQEVGGAVAWLGNDGLLVPSARDPGANLVIYAGALSPDDEFEVVQREVIEQAQGG